MSVKLLTEHHLEFLSLKIGCTGTSESTLVKMPHFWNSHVVSSRLVFTEIDYKIYFWHTANTGLDPVAEGDQLIGSATGYL